jgi:hypothetical protein
MPAAPATEPHLRPLPARDPAWQGRGERLAGGWLRFAELEAWRGGAKRGEVVPWLAAGALYPEASATLHRLVAPRHGLSGEPIASPVIVSCTPDEMAGADALWLDGAGERGDLPTIRGTATPAAAQAAGAAVWAPESWRAVEITGLPAGLRLLTPAPAPFADAAALRHGYDALAARLAGLEAAGLPRERIIVGLGAPALPAYAALGLLHGLGCPLLIEVDGGAARSGMVAAAAAVVAAAQGVQFIATHQPEAVAAAIGGWLQATGGPPA